MFRAMTHRPGRRMSAAALAFVLIGGIAASCTPAPTNPPAPNQQFCEFWDKVEEAPPAPDQAVLVKDDVVALADDTDVSGNECTDGDYAPVVLGGVAMNRTGATVKLDANAVAYGDPVTISARYIYVVRRAGASLVAGDLILGYMDLNNGGSANVGSTNAEFTVDWDAANGLFTA